MEQAQSAPHRGTVQGRRFVVVVERSGARLKDIEEKIKQTLGAR
jgi:hypothetical protein